MFYVNISTYLTYSRLRIDHKRIVKLEINFKSISSGVIYFPDRPGCHIT